MVITPQYLAGFFDGEGHLGVYAVQQGKSYNLRVGLTNTHLETLQSIQQDYGGVLHCHQRIKKNPMYRNCYFIHWHGYEAKRILEQIKPYIITKKRQVEIALDFPLNGHREYRSGLVKQKQLECRERLHRLKSDVIITPDQYIGLVEKEHSEYLRKKRLAIEMKKANPDLTIQKIADELKVSNTMIHKYLRDSGISTKREYWSRNIHPRPNPRKDEFKRLIESDPSLTNIEIAKMLDCSDELISMYRTGKR